MSDATHLPLLEQAYEALADGDLEQLEQMVATLTAQAPDDDEVMALRAEVLLAQDKADEALDLLETAIQAQARSPQLLAERASILLDACEDPLAARTDLERALLLAPSPELEADLRLMHAECCLQLQDPRAALDTAQAAARLFPDAAEPEHAVAQSLFDLHRFDEASLSVARVIDRDPRYAPAYFLRAEILDIAGDSWGAQKALDRARALDPEGFPASPALTEQDFETIVAEALDELPDSIASYLRNVAILVDERPDLETLRASDPPLSPACLGLFEGTPRPAESVEDPWSTFPKAVRLYRNNIMRTCASRDEVVDLVASTLLHEIGHFLGLDEDDLIERGLQ
ncbi:MAG: metallopeptidase family protein [Pseudomonadota bacterium]